ncbi:Hypothetical predicted protein [Mytilus galloprovincialis]|uniref:EF-hand domain-containing protein n=1 Tax=Mytilus galloprovincialis TaxID=29158 RepID=A0A8B6G7A8_MYTGA|nr:Hypothetical predicted protein [Mytilus galloprovincialis]
MAREACNEEFQNLAKAYEQDVTESLKKYQVLKDLDLFVLDNSIRESTVGQLRGHTIENKWKVYDEVKKCGFKHTIVASFNHSTRVDDVFIKQLADRGEDRAGLWAFSEITDAIKKKVPDTERIPVGLRKMKEAGLYNVIFEIDLGDSTYDFDRFTTKEMCALLKKWVDWVFENLSTEAKVFVSFRDLPDAMPTDSERVFEVTDFLCKLPLFGLMFEEPRGQSLPEECGTWAKHIRKVMDANNFNGHLLVHVHEKFGYCDVVALQVLMDGANGIWASVIKEGAAMGNAPSIITILNLIRMGNKRVLKKFNCTYLRKAAINMTRVTTGVDPHIKQPVYGARALDFVYDLNPEEFDFADFFRGTSSYSNNHPFISENGPNKNEDFTIERANLMKEVMLEDLRANRKEEYMSKCGLAVLFDRSGGKLTDEIRDEIANDPMKTPHGQNLLKEIRERWDEWDLKDKVQGDNLLDYDSFYNGFMAPYFACYRCNDTKKALQALDMDIDNSVDWSEFCVFLKWAMKQYPKTIHTADDLLEVAFPKRLIPCMRDEMLVKK